MTQVGRQWLGGRVAGRQLADLANGVERHGAQPVVERDLDAGLAADVVEDARVYRDAELFFEEEPLRTELDRVVVPVRRGIGLGGRAVAALVLDGANDAVLLLDEVELAGDA